MNHFPICISHVSVIVLADFLKSLCHLLNRTKCFRVSVATIFSSTYMLYVSHIRHYYAPKT